MTQLTTKELMLLEDNIKICQNMNKFVSSCAETVSNQQIKQLCSRISGDHQRMTQAMMEHLSGTMMQ